MRWWVRAYPQEAREWADSHLDPSIESDADVLIRLVEDAENLSDRSKQILENSSKRARSEWITGHARNITDHPPAEIPARKGLQPAGAPRAL